MHLKLEFDAYTSEHYRAVSDFLGTLSAIEAHHAALLDVERESHTSYTPPPPICAAPPVAEPVAEPVKRGRKPKEVPVAEQRVETPAAAPAPAPTPPAPAESKPITLDVLRDVLQGYASYNGMDKALALLAQFGAQRVSEIPADRAVEFIAAASVARVTA